MAQKLFLDYAGLQTFKSLMDVLIDTKDAEILRLAKEYAEGLGDNYEAAGSVASAREALEKLIGENATAIEALETSLAEGGSTANAIKAALEAAQAAQKTADENAADIEALGERVGALETDMGDVDALSTTNKTVVTAINEVLAAVGTGGTAAVVTVTESSAEGYAKVYTIKQGDSTVGTINIPKDMVVESGSVVTNPEGQEPGTYIELKLANIEEPLYVNVGTLVDLYTAKANATQVQVVIDSATREISATIVPESITSAELAADSVTTVKIADANVTKAKLSAEVQASLDKADVAESNAKAYADDLNEAMAERVQAVETALGTGEGSVTEQIATAKQEAIEAAAADAESKANTAESNAKAHADDLNEAMDTRVDTAESDIDALEASLAEGGATYVSISEAKKAGTDAQSYAEGVQSNLDESNGRIDALEGLIGEGCGAIENSAIEALFSANA